MRVMWRVRGFRSGCMLARRQQLDAPRASPCISSMWRLWELWLRKRRDWKVSCTFVLPLMCHATHPYVSCDAFICVKLRIHMCHVTHPYVWCYAFIYVMWRIHMCDVTHSYVSCDAFICVMLRIHICHVTVTHSYVSCDASICVMWRIHMCDVTQSYMSYDSCGLSEAALSSVAWRGALDARHLNASTFPRALAKQGSNPAVCVSCSVFYFVC